MNNNTKQMHSMFRGDVESIDQALTKKGLLGQVLNADVPIHFEYVSVDELYPLETQRITSGKWVEERLEDIKGYDTLAAGALSVAKDPDDGKYYVFDGCGRLALAQLNGVPNKLPCLVYGITKKRAAFYFSYNQDKGRRNIDKETIFVNSWYSGEEEALEQGKLLKELGCYIQGKTDFVVPEKLDGTPEVKHVILTKGLMKAKGDKTLMRQVRDMICTAWTPIRNRKYSIRTDLFTGLVYFLQVFPEAREGALNKTLQDFLNIHAISTPDQNQITWRKDGGSIENNEDFSVAYGMTKAFLRFLNHDKYGFQSYSKTVTLKRLEHRQKAEEIEDIKRREKIKLDTAAKKKKADNLKVKVNLSNTFDLGSTNNLFEVVDQ